MMLHLSQPSAAFHALPQASSSSALSGLPSPTAGSGPARLPGDVGWPQPNLFVGRQREMERLQTAFAHTLTGSGELVWVAGEPGIGKTRLLEEFAAVARQHQAQILWGRCREGAGAPAFWPWMQIVRAYGSAPDALHAGTATAVTDIAQLLAAAQEPQPVSLTSPGFDPEYSRFRFFDRVTTFLKQAGRHQPLVLLLDDLHWADTPSLRLLHFLAHDMRESRLLVLGTYRHGEVSRTHPLATLLGELTQSSHRLVLQGLSAVEMAQCIEQASGTVPTTSLVTVLHEQTEGNPFFVRELLRFLAAEGRLTNTAGGQGWSGSIPHEVRDTIRHRLTRLSVACVHLLTAAAVLGREFSVGLLMQVDGKASAAERTGVLSLVEEALAAAVLTDVPDSADRYRFVHALVRETLYEDLALTERIRYHRQVGETLEQLHAAHLTPYLDELAEHFFKATPGGGHDKAFQYACQAGQQAMALLAYEAAAGHYEHAVQLMELHEPSATQHCELLLALGEARWGAGDNPQAREAFVQAARVAQTMAAAELLARAALGYGTMRVETGAADEVLMTLLETALAALGNDASVLRVRLLARLAPTLYFLSCAERCQQLSWEALTLARQIGDRSTLVTALNARHFVLWGPDHLPERLALATEAVHLAEAIGDRRLVLESQVWQITDLLESGEVDAAARAIEQHARQTAVLQWARWQWQVLLMRAGQALFAGRFEAGERLALDAFAAREAGNLSNAAQFFAGQMFLLRREQGRLAELAPEMTDLAEQCTTLPIWRCGLAILYSDLGNREAAHTEFEHLAAHDFADLPRDANWLPALALLTEVCCFFQDHPRAAALYALLHPYAGRNIVCATAVTCYGSVARYLGLLATLLEHWHEAETHFDMAVRCNKQMGSRPFVAHTQHDYAQMLLRRGQPDDCQRALGCLDAAHDTAHSLGMLRLLDNITRLRQQMTTDGAWSTPTARVGASALPPTSMENTFRRLDKCWSLHFAGSTITPKPSKGLTYIAHLLQAPGREVHILDLVARTAAPSPAARSAGATPLSPSQLEEHHLHLGHSLGEAPIADATARAAYRQRLAELTDDIEDAQRCNDPARAAHAEAERQCLMAELTRAYRPGGQLRRTDESTERLRKTVTNCIRFALDKLKTAHPALWQHLVSTVRTGTWCSYQPPQPTLWQF